MNCRHNKQTNRCVKTTKKSDAKCTFNTKTHRCRSRSRSRSSSRTTSRSPSPSSSPSRSSFREFAIDFIESLRTYDENFHVPPHLTNQQIYALLKVNNPRKNKENDYYRELIYDKLQKLGFIL